MLRTLGRAFRSSDVRPRIFYTLLILVLVRVGSLIPIPGIDNSYFNTILSNLGEGSLNFINSFTGGAFSQLSLFALGITPYITASIIMQLLTIAFPRIEEIQREGEDGRKRIQKITGYVSLGLATVEAIAMGVGFGGRGLIKDAAVMTTGQYVASVIVVILALIAGSSILTWLGSRLTEKGVGNGISMILLFNIIASIPSDLTGLYEKFIQGAEAPQKALAIAIIAGVILLLVVLVCILQDGERRIPVSYSQKMAGRRVYAGKSTHIPLKVNTAGVMPIIFASSIMQFPIIIARLITRTEPEWTKYLNSTYWINPSQPIYSIGIIIYVLLILAFAYFYTNISFNPLEIADNMRRSGGVIPGVTPGKATSDYLKNILKHTVFIGAIGIMIIAIIPIVFSGVFGASVSFGGTSMIIIVGVILETMKQIEAMMRKRHYSGFLREDA